MARDLGCKFPRRKSPRVQKYDFEFKDLEELGGAL